jgi:hypothetical protein
VVKKLIAFCFLVMSNVLFAQTPAIKTTTVVQPPAAATVQTPAAAGVQAPATVTTTGIAPSEAATAPQEVTTTTQIPEAVPTATGAPAFVSSIPAATSPVTYAPEAVVPGVVEEGTTVVKPSCPPISDYPIPMGYRLAGVSPSCMGVVVPMDEPWP